MAVLAICVELVGYHQMQGTDRCGLFGWELQCDVDYRYTILSYICCLCMVFKIILLQIRWSATTDGANGTTHLLAIWSVQLNCSWRFMQHVRICHGLPKDHLCRLDVSSLNAYDLPEFIETLAQLAPKTPSAIWLLLQDNIPARIRIRDRCISRGVHM